MSSIHIESPFGSMCDEQAEIDALHDMIGRATAENLSRLLQNSYPSVGHGFRIPPKTKTEVFLAKARKQQIIDETGLEAFCHVAGIAYS